MIKKVSREITSNLLSASRLSNCGNEPETKSFHPGLVNLTSNFRKMAAFSWLPDFRSNAPCSFIYDLYELNSDCFTQRTTSQTWRLKITFNELFAFNTRYKHFYYLKLLYSGYLNKML